VLFRSTGGDGLAEVTFALERASRPGQLELLGTDDAAPYRVYWLPPPDLKPGETVSIIATVDDLRGHRAATRVSGLTLDATATALLAANTPAFGVHGATVPVVTAQPPAALTVEFGAPFTLPVGAEGTGPLTYRWFRDGVEIPGATEPTFALPRASAAWTGRYRVLVHGTAGSTLSGECAVTVNPATAGRIETLPPLTSQFVAPRRVDVWLPPDYDARVSERYPVVYMHDGQNLFDPLTGYGGNTWEVDQALCRLMQAGKIRGAIIVGVWNTGMGRFPEYMPRKAVTGGTLALYPGGPSIATDTIQSDAYLKYLVTELKPFVDRTYRTQPEAGHTFVMGSSMGGLISAYAVAEYPGVFGGAGCVSIHWPAGDGAMIGYLAQHLPKPGANRFYFDFGTATLDALYEPFQLKADAVMRAAGYTEGRDWLTRKFPGAEHSEKSWRERVDIPLTFLLGP
jgi:pimeloyl-ACP methyl ester carboxylesterase